MIEVLISTEQRATVRYERGVSWDVQDGLLNVLDGNGVVIGTHPYHAWENVHIVETPAEPTTVYVEGLDWLAREVGREVAAAVNGAAVAGRSGRGRR